MANILQDGAAWLSGQLQDHAAIAIVYSRGSATVAINATVGRTEFAVTDGTGMELRYESRDYLFPAASLILSGAAALPTEGDRITETVGGAVYDVLAPSGSQVYRYVDEFRLSFRVHTKAAT
jgi:hypothetical protein